MAIGQLFPSPDIREAMFIAGNDYFGATRQRLAIFAAGAAGLAGSFLGENDFAGATFAYCADDAA
jgi:hypothetical protein